MMSTASPWASAFWRLNSCEPECAIVPRFSSSSSAVIPMPLSATVMVRASLSNERSIASVSSTRFDSSVRPSKLSLSRASDAFEISSLRKISLLV